jgi:hypothetical protein
MDKDPTYYRGTPRIFRVHNDGELEEVYTGPENNQLRTRILPTPEGEHLMLWWAQRGAVEVVNGAFEIVHPEREIAARPGTPINLDGDDVWEIPVLEEGRLVLERPDGGEVASFALPNERVISYRIADMDRNGTGEVVLVGERNIAVLSYNPQ